METAEHLYWNGDILAISGGKTSAKMKPKLADTLWKQMGLFSEGLKNVKPLFTSQQAPQTTMRLTEHLLNESSAAPRMSVSPERHGYFQSAQVQHVRHTSSLPQSARYRWKSLQKQYFLRLLYTVMKAPLLVICNPRAFSIGRHSRFTIVFLTWGRWRSSLNTWRFQQLLAVLLAP